LNNTQVSFEVFNTKIAKIYGNLRVSKTYRFEKSQLRIGVSLGAFTLYKNIELNI